MSKISSLCLLVLSGTLAACGGGGASDSESPSPGSGPSAEGVYGGTLTNSDASHFQALVLEDDDFWAIYGEDLGSIFYVYGFVRGQGASNNGSFTANSVKDFGFSPAVSGSLTGNYNAGAGTMSGSVAYGSGDHLQFSGGQVAGSLYDYDSPASMSLITGSWSAMSAFSDNVSINVTSGGSLTVVDSGCTGTGTISPRPSGKNVFNVTVTFGGSPCLLPGQTASGIAIAYPLSTGQTQFIGAITNSARTQGIAVFGIR